MKIFGTFSGSGIFELAAQEAGMEVIGVCEIDKNCIKLLREKFPNAQLETDITNVTRDTFHTIGKPDVITGGFPCQDLSVAGRRAGLDGERSGLYFHFQRIVCEMLPPYVLVENVPGLFSSNNGKDFAIVLGGFAGFIPEIPRSGWKNSGFIKGKRYHVAWCVLDSQYFGVPQRRERVFIVASLRNGSCAEILFESESLSGNPPPSRQTRERVAATLTAGIRANSNAPGRRREDDVNLVFDMQAQGVYGESGAASTLKERDYKDATDLIITPTLGVKSSSANMHNGYEETGFIVPTIFTFNQNEDCPETEVSPAINTNANHTGRNVGKIIAPFNGTQITSKVNRSKIGNGDPSPTLDGNGQMSVIEEIWEQSHRSEGYRSSPEGLAPTLQARMGTGGNNVPMVGVRRLTPLECERLQGFPDNHTAGFSDSVRYKMTGNAVTRQPAKWILGRMKNHFDRSIGV